MKCSTLFAWTVLMVAEFACNYAKRNVSAKCTAGRFSDWRVSSSYHKSRAKIETPRNKFRRLWNAILNEDSYRDCSFAVCALFAHIRFADSLMNLLELNSELRMCQRFPVLIRAKIPRQFFMLHYYSVLSDSSSCRKYIEIGAWFFTTWTPIHGEQACR